MSVDIALLAAAACELRQLDGNACGVKENQDCGTRRLGRTRGSADETIFAEDPDPSAVAEIADHSIATPMLRWVTVVTIP